jgi:hypothetical protein
LTNDSPVSVGEIGSIRKLSYRGEMGLGVRFAPFLLAGTEGVGG